MDATFCEPSFLGKRRKSLNYSIFSDLVIPSSDRPKGIRTILFNTCAILLSVSILFLLTQVYLIFLPCLKALLWALLCGSALYPFKARLNSWLTLWLEDLNNTDGSFCTGVIQLPFKFVYRFYILMIQFIYDNYLLFIVFHFRFQIFHALSILCSIMLTILGHNKGFIAIVLIICTSAQVFLVIFQNVHIIFQFLSSFSFLPSILLLSFFYFLHCIGIIGHILFTIFAFITLVGFLVTIYNFTHDSQQQAVIRGELTTIVSVLSEKLKLLFQKVLGLALSRFNLPTDSPDNAKTNLGSQYISVLLTIFLLVLAEQMQLSTIILTISILHLVTKKAFNKINQKTASIRQLICERLCTVKSGVVAKLEKDIFFQFWMYFFLKGDQLVGDLSEI